MASEDMTSAEHRRREARRRFLKLGAAAGPAVLVVTSSPAFAAGSALNCQIPIPDSYTRLETVGKSHVQKVETIEIEDRPSSGFITGEQAAWYDGHSDDDTTEFYVHHVMGPGDDGYSCMTSVMNAGV